MAGQRLVQRLALDDGHLRPFLEEALDDAAADPAPTAGHHGDLPLQLHGFSSLSCPLAWPR
jgi:hypothetical protein